MVSIRKKRQQNRTLHGQLHGFHRDVKIGYAVSNGQQNVAVNNGSVD